MPTSGCNFFLRVMWSPCAHQPPNLLTSLSIHQLHASGPDDPQSFPRETPLAQPSCWICLEQVTSR